MFFESKKFPVHPLLISYNDFEMKIERTPLVNVYFSDESPKNTGELSKQSSPVGNSETYLRFLFFGLGFWDTGTGLVWTMAGAKPFSDT